MFAIGIWFSVAGVADLAALTVLLDRRPHRPGLPGLALVLPTAAAILWTVNLTFRLTVMTSVVAAGTPVPDRYPPIGYWAGEHLLNAAVLVGGPAMILYGPAVASGCVLARWTGSFAAAGGLLLLGQSILTGDAVPALLYPAPPPLGITAPIRSA
jgi:hypothetical protein